MRKVVGLVLLVLAVLLGLQTLHVLVFKLTSGDLYAYVVILVTALLAAACGVGGVRLLRSRPQAGAVAG